ncbi:hypothetical protein J437_LFUL015028 [Ladona fulva]|uniref:Uncharacterized protein n=1 Tax=Ladona fulva TaxID=123851 RepID=A0A8K0KJ31_LADFU|nr:hypothetical protein J437_LFUL015028 [Ladona fulva]
MHVLAAVEPRRPRRRLGSQHRLLVFMSAPRRSGPISRCFPRRFTALVPQTTAKAHLPQMEPIQGNKVKMEGQDTAEQRHLEMLAHAVRSVLRFWEGNSQLMFPYSASLPFDTVVLFGDGGVHPQPGQSRAFWRLPTPSLAKADDLITPTNCVF